MEKLSAIKLECKRLSESCLYTSTCIFIWLRCLRWTKRFFITTSLICGSLSTWNLLTSSDIESIKYIIALLAFTAGILPSIYASLKFDEKLEQYVHAAVEYKNLEHRFRQAATIDSIDTVEEYEKKFNCLNERIEQVRSLCLTPPEWCFKKAQKKIQAGHYEFDSDSVKRA